jgi:hypothetical protein
MNALDLSTFLKGSLFLDRFMTVRFRNSITNVHLPRLKNKHSAAFVFGRAMVKNPHKKIHKNSHAILRNIQASITMMMIHVVVKMAVL